MSVSPTELRGRVKGGTPLWKGKRMKRKLLLMLLCAALGLGAAQAEVYRVEREGCAGGLGGEGYAAPDLH